MKKELAIYYRKIKSKLQECRIYILKKHLKLLRAVMEIKNNEISIQTIKASLANGKMTSRSSYNGQDEAAMMVQCSDQSERAVNSGGVTRDLRKKVVRDRTTSVSVNLATADPTSAVTRERQLVGKKVKMQEIHDEEDRLKVQYRDMMYIRDADARKQLRIAKLRKMIQQIPKLSMPKINEAEEKAIKELEEMEIQHNRRFGRNKLISMTTMAKNNKGNPCVEVDTTVSVTYDTVNINTQSETVMIMILVKGDKASIRADILGDIDVQLVNQISTKIPKPLQREKDVATRQTEAQPEKTNVPDTEDETPDTIRQLEMTTAVEVEPIPSTSRSSSKSRRDSKKRTISYVEEKSTTSESSDENRKVSSTSDEEIKKKRARSTSSKKKSGEKTKTPKTRAKDGRKLADVVNRLRDSKGRLMGYKPGTQITTKRSRRKASPTRSPQTEPMPEMTPQQIEQARLRNYERRVRRKMPTQTPALATPQVVAEVRRLSTVASQPQTPEPLQSLNPLQKAEVERTRRMRSSVFPEPQATQTQIGRAHV